MEARSVLQGLTRPDELLGSPEICIAVLDGPMDLTHPCFAGADLTRIDTLVQDSPGRGPMSLHGTHVTSLLFGQHKSTVRGIAPRCRGLILPIFRDAARSVVPQLDLARAIERAVEEGAHVINISGGERAADGSADKMLERALRLCKDNGVLVVAAVGNDGCDCLQVPAAVPSVLAVGATGTDGRPLEVNNWGSTYRTNGILAAGEEIEGAAPGRGRQHLTGSSFATPLVSDVAALLIAAQLQQESKADPQAAGHAPSMTAHPSPADDAATLSAQAPNAETRIPGPESTADGSPHESGVRPSSECGCGGSPDTGCNCGGNGGGQQLIYAIGARQCAPRASARRRADEVLPCRRAHCPPAHRPGERRTVMIDYAAHDDFRLEPAQALHMPQQVPPVDRNEATPAAALSDNPAVQANRTLPGTVPWLDQLLSL